MRVQVSGYREHSFDARDGTRVEGYEVDFRAEMSGWTGMRGIQDAEHKAKLIFVTKKMLEKIGCVLAPDACFDVTFKPGSFRLESIKPAALVQGLPDISI